MKPLLLLILDGFGVAPDTPHNAIARAHTPVWNQLLEKHSYSFLDATGEAVGLPKGVMGNSEVGHLTLGAGRVIPQSLTRIHQHFQNEAFVWPKSCVQLPKTVHVLGMISDGGVHSHIDHIKAVIKGLSVTQTQVVLHAITDGRDTPPKKALDFLERLQGVTIGTVMGRFYAMDRDNRWERIEQAYRALTVPTPEQEALSAKEVVQRGYKSGVTDEFLLPTPIAGAPRIGAEDGVVFCHFRADRAREISMALSLTPQKVPFETPIKVPSAQFLTFVSFHKDFGFPVLFNKQVPKNTLGDVVSHNGVSQLRIAETEKYAHVTYFFNGGREAPFSGEKRILIPSPKEVQTYDQKPEMSVFEVTAGIVKEMMAVKKQQPGACPVIIANFANGDMVGHTGQLPAAIRAVESMDRCLGVLQETAHRAGFTIMVTSDHGNCEEMRTSKGETLTQHSRNPVPFVLVSSCSTYALRDGALSDVAPTCLDFWGWKKPIEMTGSSLLYQA